MKKITAIFLVATLVLCCAISMVGCQKEGVQDAALILRAKTLVSESAAVRELLYVNGIPTEEGAQATDGYLPADMEALAALNPAFTSLENIFESMRGIWSDSYCDAFAKRAVFTSDTEENKKYCFDKYNEETGDYEGIWVREGAFITQSHATDPVEYLYDTLKVKDVFSGQARLTMPVKVTSREDSSKTLIKTINLVLAQDENGTWLLESGLVVKYFETDNASS